MRLSYADARRLGIKIDIAPSRRTESPSRPSRRRPDDVLWQAVSELYPEARREYPGAVPGRRFRIDIALVEEKIAIEVDGWQYHGKHKSAHQADRERQNLLAVHGWLILRFTAGQIFRDVQATLATIDAAVRQRRFM